MTPHRELPGSGRELMEMRDGARLARPELKLLCIRQVSLPARAADARTRTRPGVRACAVLADDTSAMRPLHRHRIARRPADTDTGSGLHKRGELRRLPAERVDQAPQAAHRAAAAAATAAAADRANSGLEGRSRVLVLLAPAAAPVFVPAPIAATAARVARARALWAAAAAVAVVAVAHVPAAAAASVVVKLCSWCGQKRRAPRPAAAAAARGRSRAGGARDENDRLAVEPPRRAATGARASAPI